MATHYAATAWFKFEPDAQHLGTPRSGEWVLWSFVTKNGREYYSGSWYEHNGKRMIQTEYGWSAELVDAYFARVIKLPFERSETAEERRAS
jgi:hypothetical protein